MSTTLHLRFPRNRDCIVTLHRQSDDEIEHALFILEVSPKEELLFKLIERIALYLSLSDVIVVVSCVIAVLSRILGVTSVWVLVVVRVMFATERSSSAVLCKALSV